MGFVPGAEQTLVRDRAEHDDLLAVLGFAIREKPAGLEHPASPDAGQIGFGAMQSREPALIAQHHASRLVDAGRDVLHAAHLRSNRHRIVAGQRGGGAKAGGRIAEPLARGRMVVLLHRIVFGVRDQRDIVGDGERDIVGIEPAVVIFDAAGAALAFHLVVSGHDGDDVHAGGHHLLFDRRARAIADGHHRDDGATPMVMPTSVSADRSGFRRSVFVAS